jgi:hypothetical protein
MDMWRVVAARSLLYAGSVLLIWFKELPNESVRDTKVCALVLWGTGCVVGM